MFITEEQLHRLDELWARVDEAKSFQVLSPEENDKFMQLDALRTAGYSYEQQLDLIENEAFDRVWFDRSSVGNDAEPAGIPEEIRQTALRRQEEIMKEYNIDPEECDDFYHGYWSGILAMCRFLSGYYGDDIGDLRVGTGTGLLDT